MSLPVTGGQQILNPKAFAVPSPGNIGSSGRNSFAGPGLFNLDTSLARTIAFRARSESVQVTFRADFFNVLNHANLNNPSSFLGARNFGRATYGRQEQTSGFPLVLPLNETARKVQIALHIVF